MRFVKLEDEKVKETFEEKAARLAEKRQQLAARAKTRVYVATVCTYGMAFVILAAVVLSLPFPFVRRIWMKELWGYYGLLNALCFLIIANRFNHRNLSFAFAGLGVLVHDQIRIWHGVFYIRAHQGIDSGILFHVLLSLAITVFFVFVFGKAVHSIYRYQLFKSQDLQLDQSALAPRTNKKTNLVIWFVKAILFYGGIFYVARKVALLSNPDAAFGYLRILGGITFFVGFLAIGRALDRSSGGVERGPVAALKILSHAVMLGLIEWIIMNLSHVEYLIYS